MTAPEWFERFGKGLGLPLARDHETLSKHQPRFPAAYLAFALTTSISSIIQRLLLHSEQYCPTP